MKVEFRKLSEIKPYENNPRHNDSAVDAVAESVREFGFRQPIVVDKDGETASSEILNPNALSLPDAAKLLSRASGQLVTVEMLQADIAAGAPTNSNGTINLVHYAAWLLKEMGRARSA